MARRASTETLHIDGLDRPVELRRRSNARRITLGLHRATRNVFMTVPVRLSRREALEFAESQRDWIARRLADLPETIPFEFGMDLPFRGQIYRLCEGSARGVVLRDAAIEVGTTASVGATLERWLRARARERFIERSAVHARAVDRPVRRISIKDTRSRWGSCSSTGTLSFNWRLILAPDGALNYLAAHEVAHLREMNHSPRFWTIVEDLCPDFEDWRAWMRANGSDLHRYGR